MGISFVFSLPTPRRNVEIEDLWSTRRLALALAGLAGATGQDNEQWAGSDVKRGTYDSQVQELLPQVLLTMVWVVCKIRSAWGVVSDNKGDAQRSC